MFNRCSLCGIINISSFKKIIDVLIDSIINKNTFEKSLSYKIILIHTCLNYTNPKKEISNTINSFISRLEFEKVNSKYLCELIDIIKWGIKNNIYKNDNILIKLFLEELLEDFVHDHDELKSISELIYLMSPKYRNDFIPIFISIVISYWKEYLVEYVDNQNLLDDYLDGESSAGAYNSLLVDLEHFTSQYTIKISDNDLITICDYFDVDNYIENVQERLISYDDDYDKTDYFENRTNENLDIDDLFERS